MTEAFRWKVAETDGQQTLFSADEAMDKRIGVGEFRGLEFLHVRAKRVINEVPKSSRMPFRYTINAYRGCSHACVYCFARPTHEYLNLNVGEDFDTKIVVKINAVERVRAELKAGAFSGEMIAMGTNTDPYQRAEGKYQLTRGVIEELGKAGTPFSILTKSTLILRDLDVLTEAAKRTEVKTNFSIATLDGDIWRKTEPGAPHPKQRIAAIRRMTDAGLSCGVLVAPLLPGISDAEHQVREVIDACVDAGATWIAASPLHLKPGLKAHWMDWLAGTYPGLVDRYEELYAKRTYLPSADRKGTSDMSRRLVTEAKARR